MLVSEWPETATIVIKTYSGLVKIANKVVAHGVVLVVGVKDNPAVGNEVAGELFNSRQPRPLFLFLFHLTVFQKAWKALVSVMMLS